MENDEIQERFATLTTAHLADGCIRAGVPVRTLTIGAVIPATRIAGRVLPARHVGSVDIFLEALGESSPGDILVVDNGGRLDESCVGDLVTLEARGAELGGIVIWGLNRDSAEIREIGLPVFSLGALPTGPLHHLERPEDALTEARVGEWTATRGDLVAVDADGLVLIDAERARDVFAHAETIRDTEQAQAARMRDGVSLRDQVHFDDYLVARAANPALTFREHLVALKAAVEV